MSLLRPPLADVHDAAGATTGPFAGWQMPISFAGAVTEHEAVRSDVGVFDVSHLGTVWVTGAGAADTVDRAFTNDPRGLVDGRSQYTLCATTEGGVVDDLIVYRLASDRWLAVPNAANTAAVVQRLRDVAPDGVDVDDASTSWAVLAVQGPRAFALVDDAIATDTGALAFGDVVLVDVGGQESVLCRTGYTGEPGVELVVPAEVATGLWERLVEAGAQRCGLAARDSLRLEMGYPLHGDELGSDRGPFEAGAGWAVKTDGRDFVGSAALVAAREAGPTRRLRGLVGEGRRPFRSGMDVLLDGEVIGTTSSGGWSPVLGVGIALTSLDRGVAIGTAVDVDVRGRPTPAVVAAPPMVDRDPR